MDASLQVAEAAAREGLPGRQRMRQAMTLAERYHVAAWPVAMRYAEAALLAGAADADVQACLQAGR